MKASLGKDRASSREFVPRHTWVYDLTSALFRGYLRLGSWHVEGRENVPLEGPLILAPNHVSILDPPLVGVSSPRRFFIMSKAELFHGLQGWTFSRMGAFPVRRGQVDRAALKIGRQTLRDGGALLLFPEGTRSSDGVLGRPEVGVAMMAHAARAAIVPVAVDGTQSSLSRQHKGLHRINARVRFGAPLDMDDLYDRKADRATLDAIGERVMAGIAAELATLRGESAAN